MISYLYAALIAVGTLVIGILLGIWIRKRAAKRAEEKISNADEEALRIVNEAIKSAENKKREVMLEAKEDILRSRNEYEKEVKERRAEQQKQERRLQQKEENSTARPTRWKSARRLSTRSMPLWTRKTKKSRSSSAARPKCLSAFPVSLQKTPRST